MNDVDGTLVHIYIIMYNENVSMAVSRGCMGHWNAPTHTHTGPRCVGASTHSTQISNEGRAINNHDGQTARMKFFGALCGGVDSVAG